MRLSNEAARASVSTEPTTDRTAQNILREQYGWKLRTETACDRSDSRPLTNCTKTSLATCERRSKAGLYLKGRRTNGYLSSEPEEEIELTALPAARKDVTRVFLQATIK